MGPANLHRMRLALALRALVLSLALVGWAASPALAAPMVLSTDPEAGAELHEPPTTITMEFSEPLQAASGLKVIDECGDKVSRGEATIGGTAMNELSIATPDAPHNGTYTVSYVATGVTGTASGSFTFFVHAGTGCSGSSTGGHHPGGSNNGNGGNNHGEHTGGTGNGGNDRSGAHSSTGTSHQGSGTGHEAASGHGSSGSSSGNQQRHGNGHQSKDGAKHGGKHPGNASGTGSTEGSTTVAAGADAGLPTDIPTSTTVLIALSLAVVLGLAGGWILRVSSPS